MRGKLYVVPSRSHVTCAASLAHHGLLGPVERLRLFVVDLTSVPVKQLTSLVSCVTDDLFIRSVSGCDLTRVLEAVRCRNLFIDSQALGSEETQALMWAMESSVEKLGLGQDGDMTLDISVLVQYSGHGKCRWIKCYYETAANYREKLRLWAESKHWKVSVDHASCIKINGINSTTDQY